MRKKIFSLLVLLFLFSCAPLLSNAQSDRDNVNTARSSSNLDTARDVTYLTTVEKDVILELNMVRTNPASYAEKYVKPMQKLYDGNELQYPGEITIITNEGIDAVKECYNVLKSAKPVGLLYPSLGMSKAAKDLVADQGPTGETGHEASDGSSPFDRMNRYGQWETYAGENVDYGNNIAQRIVLSLIIDDGVSSRGHRKNIMNPAFAVIGIATGKHKVYRHMCVMDLAGDYTEQ